MRAARQRWRGNVRRNDASRHGGVHRLAVVAGLYASGSPSDTECPRSPRREVERRSPQLIDSVWTPRQWGIYAIGRLRTLGERDRKSKEVRALAGADWSTASQLVEADSGATSWARPGDTSLPRMRSAPDRERERECRRRSVGGPRKLVGRPHGWCRFARRRCWCSRLRLGRRRPIGRRRRRRLRVCSRPLRAGIGSCWRPVITVGGRVGRSRAW